MQPRLTGNPEHALSAPMNAYRSLTDGPFAKKAAAFPRNSLSSRSCLFSRSSWASRARSLTDNGDSDTGCSSRYFATQFPSVPS